MTASEDMHSRANKAPLPNSQVNESPRLARELIHELQNHLHLAIMEVELAQMGASHGFDYVKLLGILDALKHSLHALQDCLLASANSRREDRMMSITEVLAELRNKGESNNFTVTLMRDSYMPRAESNAEHVRVALGRLLVHCGQVLNDAAAPANGVQSIGKDPRSCAEIAITLPITETKMDRG